MYSGLLPKGLSEAELSSDEEEEPTDEEEEPNAQSDTETEKLQAESDPNVPNDLTPSAPKSPSAPSSPPESCWPGVSQELCQKFKDLQKKRESQKTDKPPGRKRGKKRHRKGGTCKQTSGDAEEKKDGEEIRLKKLQELTQYFGTNDRFQPPVCSRPSPKSGLEKNMERAIAEGDYGKAEELSDRLATRELAVKLAQAVDCRDFARARREEEDSRAAERKRKQIAWGFEAKKRWETKSNMGYM